MSAPALTRRAALAGLAATGLGLRPRRGRAAGAPPPALGQSLAPLWAAWKGAISPPEGRVREGYQNGASHSEGQGYGMLLAEAMGDAATFAALWRWTGANLAIRPGDPLLAWHWRPEADPPVEDPNNASDGDLFCARDLLRASERFG